MSRRKSIVLTLAGLLLLFGVPFSFWYRVHHSMTVVRPFTSGDVSLPQHVLIATQGSQFKDTLVGEIVQHLAARSVYVQVMDISGWSSVREDEWSAIVVLHTWEFGKPPPAASAFLDRIRDKRKVIVVTTSGSGHEKLPNGVDAISAASVVSDIPVLLAEVAKRLDALLQAGPAAAGR